MFAHLLLGLLRDGEPRHGYQLTTEYMARSGNQASAGSFYRVLARLATQKLVSPGTNPADADERRIPYRITEAGTQVFDRWLVSSGSSEETWERLLFIDRVPREALTRLLDRWQEDLWMQGKALVRRHSDALQDCAEGPRGRFNPLHISLARRIKQVEAERAKTLERARDRALVAPAGNQEGFSVPAALLSRRVQHVTTDLAFLEEMRASITRWLPMSLAAAVPVPAADLVDALAVPAPPPRRLAQRARTGGRS
jgi:DNA-binding PadR family transcriptional regulator